MVGIWTSVAVNATPIRSAHDREGYMKLHDRRQLLQFAVAAAALTEIACMSFVITTNARAQEFPSKNITLMMPYAAGGPGDTLTRIIGQGMGKALGRQILVENVAGAGGTIGTAKVAASAPDGHSLLLMHFGHAVNSALYRNLRYDPIKDFEPIGMIAESPMAIVARKDFPVSNFDALVAHVKTSMGKVVHGHAGIGSASHLCGLLFLNSIEATVTVVPYRGTGPALNDLIGGQFDFMCDQTLNVLQPIQNGLIKAGDDQEASRGASSFADRRRIGFTGLRDHRLVRHVGAQGHTEACD